MKLQKSILLLFVCLHFSVACFSQGMGQLFLMLPNEYVSDLNQQERKLLLEKRSYILPGGDSIETVKYKLDSTLRKDYLRFELSFPTGQSGFTLSELRKFKRTDGSQILVYSKYAGTPAAYERIALVVFDINENHLVENKENLLPADLPLSDFVSKTLADSLIAKTITNLNSFYDLMQSDIEYRVFSHVSIPDGYLAGTAIPFKWNGKTFIKGEVRE